MMITNKELYRGYSHGSFYYAYATSLSEAKSLLRRKALGKVGKYSFTAIQMKKGNGWKEILTSIQ